MKLMHPAEKYRVLFITEFLPWPLNSGGRIRSYHIIKQMSRRHDVTLVAARFDDVEEQFREFVPRLRTVEVRPKSTLTKACGALCTLWSPQPYIAAFSHFRQGLARMITEEVSKGSFDIIHLDHLDAAVYLPYCDQGSVYLDEHNYETKLFQSVRSNTANILLRWYVEQQLQKLTRYESEVLQRAHAVGAVSEQDADLMTEHIPREKIEVVPNGVDLDFFDIDHAPRPFHIVTVGSLDWPPNVDGLFWFLDKVWPIISCQCPEATFQIVGRKPPKSLLDRVDDRVTIAADVPDIRDYVKTASAFIVPLFAGGGTRLKVLEAMAMRMPVIATPVGGEGINCQDGKEVMLAEQPEAFAAKVMEVLHKRELAEKISHQARALVEQQYGWPVIGDRLNKIYRRLVDHRAYAFP